MRTDSSTLESPLDECNVARIAGLSVASVRRWRLMKVIGTTRIGAADFGGVTQAAARNER